MYVYARHANGCATVNETRQKDWMCPVTKPMPEVLAKRYEAYNGVINASLKLLASDPNIQMNATCTAATKALLCKQITPECLQNGLEVDHGDCKSLCEAVNNSCSDGSVFSLSITGKYKEKGCVRASQPVEGTCATPKYKVSVCHHYSLNSQPISSLRRQSYAGWVIGRKKVESL